MNLKKWLRRDKDKNAHSCCEEENKLFLMMM